jgi:D-threonate/D-erythronate kinase
VRMLVGCRLDLTDGTSLLVYPQGRPGYSRLCRLSAWARAAPARVPRSDMAGRGRAQRRSKLPSCCLTSPMRRCRPLWHGCAPTLATALTLRRRPNDAVRLQRLADAAAASRVATGDGLCHMPQRRILRDVMTCIREGCTHRRCRFPPESQKTTWFSGLSGLWVQDAACQSGLTPIYGCNTEHLSTSDAGIVMTRRMLLDSAAVYEQRRVEPAVPLRTRSPSRNQPRLTYRAPAYTANFPMIALRLLADDLTGALDSAAEFVALAGPVNTFWHGAIPPELPKNAALDSGTRELQPAQAATIVSSLAQHLPGASIAFKKIDSLIRGQTIVELTAATRGWQYCVLAPAFPFHGRITRSARQYARLGDNDWQPAGGELVAALQALGVNAQPGQLNTTLQPGITVFDAETDDDLTQIVATVRRCPHPVLWSGTGGLAQALATGAVTTALPPLPHPILGLFGSDQSATAAQLAACEPHWTILPDGGSASARHVTLRLATTGIALTSFHLPPETPRPVAADHIARQIDQLLQPLDPPGTLLVAGGETLRSVCQTLGATRALSS